MIDDAIKLNKQNGPVYATCTTTLHKIILLKNENAWKQIEVKVIVQKEKGGGHLPSFRHFLVNTVRGIPLTREIRHGNTTTLCSLFLLHPFASCESAPQVDAQTRAIRFKGSLTSDQGFFSSVKQRVRFHSIWLTGKAMKAEGEEADST